MVIASKLAVNLLSVSITFVAGFEITRIHRFSFKTLSFFILSVKVLLFWEDHKNLRNRPYGFDVYVLSKCHNHRDDCTNFCGLLTQPELYLARSFLAFLYQNIITGFSRCTSAFPDICVLHTTSWLGIWCLRLGTKGKNDHVWTH